MWKKSDRNYRICLRETNHSFESISKDLARNITANTEDMSKLVSSGTISAKSDGMEKPNITSCTALIIFSCSYFVYSVLSFHQDISIKNTVFKFTNQVVVVVPVYYLSF